MKTYYVSLAFVESETMSVEAETPEEALRIARQQYDDGDWDGHLSDRGRIETDDIVTEPQVRTDEGTGESCTVMVNVLHEGRTDILRGFDSRRQVAITWDIQDLQESRPYLTDDQCMEILEYAVRKVDHEYGFSWQYLYDTADNLYPKGACGFYNYIIRSTDADDVICDKPYTLTTQARWSEKGRESETELEARILAEVAQELNIPVEHLFIEDSSYEELDEDEEDEE